MSLKFKRNYPLILLLVAVLAFFTFAMGGQRIVAYTVRAKGQQTAQVASTRFDITNDVALFDDSLVHSIQVVMSEEDYDKMITNYQETELKEYSQVDIMIDGVRINDVGIRLKGNASLRTALGGGMGGGNRPGKAQEMTDRPQGADKAITPGVPADGERPEPPAKAQAPGADLGPAQDGFAQAGGEVKIPFMVKFDEYVDGQTYEGYTAIAVRTYGTSSDAAMLQEPVTNEAARLVGLPATQTAYAGFQINDANERLYVISELVNQEYLTKYFENADGVLYKAEVGSTLSYEGEDPSSYANSFTQQTRVNDADLAPLIAFMRFLDQADDATFESELPDYLDVDAFATYLAVNDLLVNTDSIIGMNNNYYLYYDAAAERFTLLMWDANESMGKLGGSTTYDLYFNNSQGGQGGRGGGPGGGMGGGRNTLLTRFMASERFRALYEEKLQMVYAQAFLSGAMTETVERYSALIHSVNDERNLVDIDSYQQAVEKMLTFIDQRTEYLASTELLAQYSTQGIPSYGQNEQ